MSNRTLFEINHDAAGMIEREPVTFATIMLRYLNSADADSAEALGLFGVRVLGMRHHSEPFDVQWGAAKVSEK